MSDYDSSSEGSEDNQKEQQYFRVFQQDFYLTDSFPNIEQWKQHIQSSMTKNTNLIMSQDKQTPNQLKEVDVFKYLQLEENIFVKEENYLLAAYHIRFYSFAFYLRKAFQAMVKQYQEAYSAQKFDRELIKKLDEKVVILSVYLQKLQLSRAQSYVTQVDSQLIGHIYGLLQVIFPYILSTYCIWRVVMFLEIMNQENNSYILNIPFHMSLEYYLKTFKTLKSKNQQLSEVALIINPEIEKSDYISAYVNAIRQISKFNSKPKQEQDKIDASLLCEYLSCLRYMHFATSEQHKTENNLYQEYIMSSLKVPYYGKNQNMPVQYYEKLFLRILTQIKNKPELIDLALYIDPNVVGQRSKESFGKLQETVIRLCQQLTEAQQSFLTIKQQPQQQYIKRLLKAEQFTLLIQFLQTIMEFNKSAFLKADNDTYEIFLEMADFLKSAFLSFGKDLWLFPQNIFTPLTLGFFKKISEDINDDLKNLLYQMVQNLNLDRMPEKLSFQNGQFKLQKVTRLEYLSVIMYYIEDCSRQEEYLNLPQIAPINFETSILLVKSIHVKLKHHEPNPAQLPLFIEYLKECEKYKLNINFNWYKLESFLTKGLERETEFQIESALPHKEIQKHFRKCLNYRDKEYARKLIQEVYNQKRLISAVQLAALLKYNHGIQGLPEIRNIREEEIFSILEEMQMMLAILPDDLFDLPLEEQVNVSYLHILLTFYCSKIKEAKGSEIYLMILQKVLLNYLKSPFSRSKQFKQKYPKFFQRFIYQYHQIEICSTLNEMLMQFQDKYLPFAKDENLWSVQQKTAVTDLKEKIEIIREQFLDKLQGQEEDIAMFIVTFTSLISEGLPFVIFLECLRLFVKLLNRKPSLKDFTSVDIFLSEQTYLQPNFFFRILVYFEDYHTQDSTEKKEIKCYILRHILKSTQILDILTFKELMELLSFSKKLLKTDTEVDELSEFYQSLKKIVQSQPQKIRPEWILPYISLYYQNQLETLGDFSIFEQDPDKKTNQNKQKLQSLMNTLMKLGSQNDFWSKVRENLRDFKFKDFQFMFTFSEQLKSLSKGKPGNITFKDVWVYFLNQLCDPSWTFYYMVQLNDPSLINIHQNRDEMLINLIKNEKLTKDSYPIFKNTISETKNMPVILDKIMQSYEKEEYYIQNYQFHNKLILINERFPDTRIEECIMRWIQVGENKMPLKIPQNYYINFLKKKLKNLPDNIAYDSILKVNKTPQDLPKLTKQIQKIFEILLYFPVKKFHAYTLSKIIQEKPSIKEKQTTKEEKQGKNKQEKGKIKQEKGKKEQKFEQKPQVQDDWNSQQIEQGDQNDWQQEDDNQEVQIKKTVDSKNGKKQQQQKANFYEDNQSQAQLSQPSDSQQSNQENDQNQQQNDSYCQDQRPQILQIFYQQQKKDQLQGYKRFCLLREQLDIYLKSDYNKLDNSPILDNGFIHDNLLAIIKELTNMHNTIQQSILVHIPDPLLYALKKLGYNKDRDKQKIEKMRKPKTKILHFKGELFSDRGESDGSQALNQDDYGNQEYQEGDEEDYLDSSQVEGDYGEHQEEEGPSQFKKKIGRQQQKKQQEQQIELPQLSSQFSKVQAEIKGSQLQRRQLIKILQVFLVQLFKLTPINFKKKEIVFSYLEIMESDLSQTFFESVLTILRMDQNPKKNRKVVLEQMKNQLLKNNSPHQLEELSGFAEFSKYNGLVNFLYLLKVLKDKGKYRDDETNPFKKQSGTILPIAENFIIEFDLPLQTNVFSLVLLYIHSKQKIRELIEDISVSYDEDGPKLSKKQIKRISEAFLVEKAHNSVWQFIESTISYKVSDTDRLIISLDTYSQDVFKSLASSGMRVKQTIEKNNEAYSSKSLISQKQIKANNLTHIKHYQRLYYITSNLLSSCSNEIKQFYFMNKNVCRYLWQDDNENEDNYNYNRVPSKLLKCKDEIYDNQSFVLLLELAFRIIYFVKKELYGKISPKKFARLIHYPKLIIETATLYMNLSGVKGKKTNWNFKPKKEVIEIIQKTQMGQTKFKNLIEVYNLILGILQIESFSTGKFKELLIPYFTENKHIGLQAPLMFKVPQIDEDVNGQNIFVTRECSFDMAFYQVNGQGLFVEFHGEEGSDHGGMIRELMMGWKGHGVGEEDFFIGKILGVSFRQSVPYGGHVDLEMCIRITNYKITMQNLQEIDKEIYNSLKFIIQNDPTDLGLTFSLMKKNPKSFEVQEFNLKPNGGDIPVTQQNKMEYIKLYLQKYHSIGRQHQLNQIATGFYTVVPQNYASIFKPHELMQHLKGQQVCDINVLKAHVKYTEGYTETSVIIKWLWEILQSYNQEQLNKFIQFLTGSPKLPIFNPNFEITVERVFDVKNLPVAHTCFNTLDLPQYPTKAILEKNMLTAIFEGNENFGIM